MSTWCQPVSNANDKSSLGILISKLCTKHPVPASNIVLELSYGTISDSVIVGASGRTPAVHLWEAIRRHGWGETKL